MVGTGKFALMVGSVKGMTTDMRRVREMGLADWFESKGFESKDMNTWTPDFPEDDDDFDDDDDPIGSP